MCTRIPTLAAVALWLLSATSPASAASFGGLADAAASALGGATETPSVSSGLVSALTSQLGVTPTQATVGAGAMLGQAMNAMAPDDWSQVAGAIPGADALISAAPSPAVMGLASSAAGLLGGNSAMAALAPAFESVGLDAAMVSQFAPVILSFVQAQAGPQTSALLSAVLPAGS